LIFPFYENPKDIPKLLKIDDTDPDHPFYFYQAQPEDRQEQSISTTLMAIKP